MASALIVPRRREGGERKEEEAYTRNSRRLASPDGETLSGMQERTSSLAGPDVVSAQQERRSWLGSTQYRASTRRLGSVQLITPRIFMVSADETYTEMHPNGVRAIRISRNRQKSFAPRRNGTKTEE